MKNWTKLLAATGVLGGLLLAATGCLKPEIANTVPVQSYTSGSPEAMATTDQEGDYILFWVITETDSDGKVEDKSKPIARTHLMPGTPIGFKATAKDTEGKTVGGKDIVVAIAGDMVVPVIANRPYEWRVVPGSTAANKNENPYWPRP